MVQKRTILTHLDSDKVVILRKENFNSSTVQNIKKLI